jgi:uncharacterized damage-inducible protein DinB
MTVLLVTQLRFARSEFRRALEGVTEEDAVRRILPLNAISWMVGHMANQENRYWVNLAQGKTIFPRLNDLVGYHKPASTPALAEMWAAWQEITSAADIYFDSLASSDLTNFFTWKDKPVQENVGTLLQRNTFHYWYHTGEAAAVRQMLGHTDLPEFVGDMSANFYHAEE